MLLVVHGLPATGKTTLAQWLSRKLSWPAIHKDTIKEILFDTLGSKDRVWSSHLGGGAIELVYHFVDIQLSANSSCIAECNFKPALASPRLREILARNQAQCMQLMCHTEGYTRLQRFQARQRHIGHADAEVTDAAAEAWRSETLATLDLPGPCIEIDTTDLSRVDYSAILSQVQAFQKP